MLHDSRCRICGVAHLEPGQGGVQGLLRPLRRLPTEALVVLAVQVRLLLRVASRCSIKALSVLGCHIHGHQCFEHLSPHHQHIFGH